MSQKPLEETKFSSSTSSKSSGQVGNRVKAFSEASPSFYSHKSYDELSGDENHGALRVSRIQAKQNSEDSRSSPKTNGVVRSQRLHTKYNTTDTVAFPNHLTSGATTIQGDHISIDVADPVGSPPALPPPIIIGDSNLRSIRLIGSPGAGNCASEHLNPLNLFESETPPKPNPFIGSPVNRPFEETGELPPFAIDDL